ncbi:unnamed protein product [Staurois parvus]|uniref:Uncharacterized protein n=1 Tax=Staurois parvus TaxID=386267 RepID=A0ABN9BCD9_9NEOB|nr:unnamed protein product [Staurois parvus]
MHPPKKKKTSVAIHTKLIMCRVTTVSVCIRWSFQQEMGQRRKNQTTLFTQLRGLTP